ncbi:KR domain-containing protein [Nostoc sp.]|uniref:KR domain-containing protein n=1 Tax=Nostoc sp. TaxID=1180 RepID=UPI002FF882B1
MLFLTHSLTKLKISERHRLQLWVISNNILEVDGNEKIDPEKASILSLCKVIPQEYPSITCRCIDITLKNCQNTLHSEAGEGDTYGIIDQLLNELMAVSSTLVVAYRGSYRWVQTFEPLLLESVLEEKIPLKKQDVYLFTGGLESIEVVLAEYLAKTFQAKLIFIENLTFPEKHEYLQWLDTHVQEDNVSCKLQKLLELEKLCAKILVIRADTTNYEQIYQSLYSENIGNINGVIYSNRIKHENIFSSIPEICQIELKKILDSQLCTINILEKVLENIKLDFWIISSSLSSILGGFGLCLYSASNQIIDSFITKRNQNSSLPWYTVNWEKLQLNLIQEKKQLNMHTELKQLLI